MGVGLLFRTGNKRKCRSGLPSKCAFVFVFWGGGGYESPFFFSPSKNTVPIFLDGTVFAKSATWFVKHIALERRCSTALCAFLATAVRSRIIGTVYEMHFFNEVLFSFFFFQLNHFLNSFQTHLYNKIICTLIVNI